MNFCYKFKFLLLRKIESERVKSNQSCNFPKYITLNTFRVDYFLKLF